MYTCITKNYSGVCVVESKDRLSTSGHRYFQTIVAYQTRKIDVDLPSRRHERPIDKDHFT